MMFLCFSIFACMCMMIDIVNSTSDLSFYECYSNNNKSTPIQKICEEENKLAKIFFPSNDSIFHSHNHLTIQTDDLPFFKNSFFNFHRDVRFANQELSTTTTAERKSVMSNLIKQWKDFTNERQVIYWLAHSALLGWYWQQDLLPWDYDSATVQILASDLFHQYVHFNESLFRERYLFDVNPHITHRQHQSNNVVDAKFIDTENGYFVEVTAVEYNNKHNALHCKSPHYYKPEMLFPLRAASFSGIDTWVPNRVVDVLLKEYGQKALTALSHRDRPLVNLRVGRQSQQTYQLGGRLYRFDRKTKVWVLV